MGRMSPEISSSAHPASSLSPCQRSAFGLLNSPENIFLTGGAGTGKSFLIRQFLQSKPAKTFPVLASTGAAAVLVGGRTFHSVLGLGIMEGGVQSTVERALKNRRVVKRLRDIEGFVLDEVSMISAPTFRAAETICRLARDKRLPWGGLQVIAVGDFAQLPPVQNFADRRRQWAFTDPSWNFSSFKTVSLETPMRFQDEEFLGVLARVRRGQVDAEVTRYLNERCFDDDGEFAGTRLFPRKDATENYNLQKLNELETPLRVYETLYHGKEEKIQQLKALTPVPEKLQLRKDCLVMLRQNDPKQRWVNGSLAHARELEKEFLLLELFNGRLVELERSSFSLQDADGTTVAVAENFPVTLAYATTIHKAQGATFDRLRVDLRRLWEPGHAYVALSRVTKGDALFIDGWSPASIKVDPEVTRFYQRAASASEQGVDHILDAENVSN